MRSSFPALQSIALAAIALATALALPAAAKEPPTTIVHAVLAVDVDVDGRAVSIEPAEQHAQGLIDFLRREVSGWTFEPGRLGDLPVPTRTSVIIALEARQVDDDYQLQIIDARTGPRSDAAKPPSYPTESVRRREVGEVHILVEIGAEGLPKSVAIERSNAGKRLETAALAAVKRWTFIPESVGGKGVPAVVLVPINFCLDRVCRRLPPTPGADGADDSPRLVGEPAVRIKDRRAAG